jgi:signal transduction histidine kinase
VTNVLRHSEATAVTITVEIAPDGGTGDFLVLRIQNDGVREDGSAAARGDPSVTVVQPETVP